MRAAGAAAVVLCVAGCRARSGQDVAAGTSSGGDSTQPASHATSSHEPSPATSSTGLPLAAVSGTAAAASSKAASPALTPTRLGWFAVRSDVNPRVVVITFGSGDCDGAAHATAADAGKFVSVSLVVNQQRSGACDAALRLRDLSVQLPRDLGRRNVYDPVDHLLHKPFAGADLLIPRHLPAAFVVVHETSSDAGPSNPSTAQAARYWVRMWSLPETGGSTRTVPDCSVPAPRALQLGQGPGALPQWGAWQVHQVGIVRLDGLNVPLLQVPAGDLSLSWRDPTSHQDIQLESVRQCEAAAPYSVAEFTQIAKSLTKAR